MNKPETPELDRYVEACESTGGILAEFWDFLHDQKRYVLAAYQDVVDEWQDIRGRSHEDVQAKLLPVDVDPERLFAEFLGLDLDKVAEERRRLFDWVRRKRGQTASPVGQEDANQT